MRYSRMCKDLEGRNIKSAMGVKKNVKWHERSSIGKPFTIFQSHNWKRLLYRAS